MNKLWFVGIVVSVVAFLLSKLVTPFGAGVILLAVGFVGHPRIPLQKIPHAFFSHEETLTAMERVMMAAGCLILSSIHTGLPMGLESLVSWAFVAGFLFLLWTAADVFGSPENSNVGVRMLVIAPFIGIFAGFAYFFWSRWNKITGANEMWAEFTTFCKGNQTA